jgi:hypothetical protein
MQLVAHSTASHYAEVSEQNRAQLTEDLKEVNKPGLAVLRRREEAFRKELHALEQTGPGEKPAAFSNSNWEQSVVQELRRSESPGYKASFYAHIGLGQAVPPERTFWNRGGTTTISGALTLAGGAFVLGSNPVGWGALLLGGFAVAGGTFGVGAGSVQLITSYSGSTTLEQDLTAGEAFSVTADMGGHPFGLAGGLIGMTLDRGDEIGPAAAIGNLTGSAFGLLPGALRNRELLKPRIWGTRETFENEKALWTVSQSGKLSNPKQGAISSWVGSNAERYRLHLGITRLGVSGYTKGQRYLGNQGTSAPTAEPNYGYLPLVSGSF